MRSGLTDIIKKGGGLAAYIKEEIHVDNILLSHMNKSVADIELQCLILRPPSQKKYLLLNVYRPPNGDVQAFLELLTESLDQLALQENLETYIMGNFIIDITDSQNENSKSLLENLQQFGFSQKINTPTRFGKNNRPSLIDHVYTNSEHISDASTVSLNISDHDLIYVVRKKDKMEKIKLSFRGRSYRNYNIEIFQDNLANYNWDILYDCDDVNQAWSIILNRIESEIESMCPLKDIKIKKQKDPWITNEILELINDKHFLLSTAKQNSVRGRLASSKSRQKSCIGSN